MSGHATLGTEFKSFTSLVRSPCAEPHSDRDTKERETGHPVRDQDLSRISSTEREQDRGRPDRLDLAICLSTPMGNLILVPYYILLGRGVSMLSYSILSATSLEVSRVAFPISLTSINRAIE